MSETWIDGKGVAFSDHRKHLPELARDFPTPTIDRDIEAATMYRRRFSYCQLCGKTLRQWDVRAELHHIFGGPRRSDVWTNLMTLCNGSTGCHQMIQHQKSMLRIVLAAKCMTDPEYTDWVALALLRGSHLPEPEWPASWRAARESHLGKRGA